MNQKQVDIEPGVGQVWNHKKNNPSAYPESVRIVCSYPFAQPGDGVLWIVETVGTYQRLILIPAETLISLYDLLSL